MAELTQTPASTGGARTSKKLSTRVDLTAMVDLAFLLVTFFMLTTTLTKPGAMSLVMPDGKDPGGVMASRTVTLCLGKNNQLVYYRGTIEKPIDAPQTIGYNKNGLRHALLNTSALIRKQTGRPMIVVIKPGQHSVYDNLVNAIDELNITQNNIYAVTDISAKDVDLLKQRNIY
jgi:biopolymer transport protein ExbD